MKNRDNFSLWLFDCIGGITFFDNQVIRPLPKFSLFFDALDKFKKTVFEFEGQVIQSFEIFQENLAGFPAGIKPGN